MFWRFSVTDRFTNRTILSFQDFFYKVSHTIRRRLRLQLTQVINYNTFYWVVHIVQRQQPLHLGMGCIDINKSVYMRNSFVGVVALRGWAFSNQHILLLRDFFRFVSEMQRSHPKIGTCKSRKSSHPARMYLNIPEERSSHR